MTNWEECIAAPGNLFRPELNHVLRPQRTDHWFILTELLTGSERSWRSAFTQFHLSVSYLRGLVGIHCRPKVLGQDTEKYIEYKCISIIYIYIYIIKMTYVHIIKKGDYTV